MNIEATPFIKDSTMEVSHLLSSNDFELEYLHYTEDRNDDSLLEQHLLLLNKRLRDVVDNLRNEKDSETKRELMDMLLQMYLDEDEFYQEQAANLGACLAHLFKDELSRIIFPAEVNEENIENSIGTPLFVLCRSLCQATKEDPSRPPLLAIMKELDFYHQQVGFYLLYYMHASKMVDTSAYKDLLKSRQEHNDFIIELLADLKLCQERDIRMFFYIIPYVYDRFKESVIGNVELLYLVVSIIDTYQLEELLFRSNMIVFGNDSVVDVLMASLSWDPWPQIAVWKFLQASNIPIDFILPILDKLDHDEHPIAMTNLLLLLIQEEPSPERLRHIMCRKSKSGDLFSVSILNFWSRDRKNTLAECIAAQLTKAAPMKNKWQDQAIRNNVLPTVENILAHLNELQQTCKDVAFFKTDSLKSSLIQIRNSCSDAQRTKYSDLFALVEDKENRKPPKARNLEGRSYRPTYNRIISATDSDSSEED